MVRFNKHTLDSAGPTGTHLQVGDQTLLKNHIFLNFYNLCELFHKRFATSFSDHDFSRRFFIYFVWGSAGAGDIPGVSVTGARPVYFTAYMIVL